MMNLPKYLLIFITALSILSSCRAYKPVVYQSSAGSVEDTYIKNYAEIAVKEMKRTGVPASITLAQGMIESDYGRSTLAKSANNHFGIKCHNSWTGETVRHNDDRNNECFRKYRDPEESFRDHSDFLRTGSRYSFLFNLPSDDYRSWAKGLKKAGYATNPEYANMLIRKIEQMNLAEYDRGYVAQKNSGRSTQSWQQEKPEETFGSRMSGEKTSSPPIETEGVVARVPRLMENNRIQCIIVKDGDTREKIEKEFNLLRWELPRYNELPADFALQPGQILYFQPKRERAEPGKDFYTAMEGDSMYLISQKFGIKLKNIYELNRMEAGTEPVPGQKIWLRNIKPVN